MVGISEAAYGIAVGAATKEYEVGGSWQPNQLLANAGKIVGVDGFNRVIMNLTEIAGVFL